MLLTNENKKELANICLAHSFTKRGQAFFRVHGDGVLQIIKFEYEKCLTHYELSIGLQSMYSELLPQHFTSGGCIPNYYVFAPAGIKSAVSYSKQNHLVSFAIDPPDKQIVFLRDVCMGWLDSITTQEILVKTLCALEPTRWNASERIAPFLACKDYQAAERVISAILHQHYSARQRGVWNQPPWNELPWTHELYEKYHMLWPEEDLNFLQFHEWIYNKDEKSIKIYLQANYTKNCKLAHWIRRTGQGDGSVIPSPPLKNGDSIS